MVTTKRRRRRRRRRRRGDDVGSGKEKGVEVGTRRRTWWRWR